MNLLQLKKKITKCLRNLLNSKEQIMMIMIILLICWCVYLTYKIKQNKEFFVDETVVGKFAITNNGDTLIVPKLIVGSGKNTVKIDPNPVSGGQIKLFRNSNSNSADLSGSSTGELNIGGKTETIKSNGKNVMLLGNQYKIAHHYDNQKSFLTMTSKPNTWPYYVMTPTKEVEKKKVSASFE